MRCAVARPIHLLSVRARELTRLRLLLHICQCAQNNLLKYKVELLVDMVTLANLDCDKFEDELAGLGKGES